MAEEKGIQETLELLKAAKSIAVLVYKAQKAGGTAGEIAQRIVGLVMANPAIVNDLKAAAEGISNVTGELRDLSISEVFAFIAEAGRLAKEASEEIKG